MSSIYEPLSYGCPGFDERYINIAGEDATSEFTLGQVQSDNGIAELLEDPPLIDDKPFFFD